VTRTPSRLASSRFDLLIVGGGIHGLATAYEAAARGLSVALVERGDFGQASSFNHLKTVHGGLRSLQTADLQRFREGIRERRRIARIAPHLVEPLAFLLPALPKLTRSRLALRAAFVIDAVLGADRNQGLPAHLHLPAGRVLGRDLALERVPLWRNTPATGAARWFDYQMPRAERLTLAFAHAADRHGAVLCNHVEALDAVVDDGRVRALQVNDTQSGDTFDVEADVVVNCAGAYAGVFASRFGARTPFPLQKALNLVTRRPWRGDAVGAALHGGTLFLVPWEGHLIVGTWHDDREFEPKESGVAEVELARCLDDVNAAFPGLDLARAEVSMVHRGLVPGVRTPRGVEMRTRGALLDHAADGVEGAISVIGVKYTTACAVADRAVSLAARKLGRRLPASPTASAPLPGGDLTSIAAEVEELEQGYPAVTLGSAEHLVRSYGSGWPAVVAIAGDSPHLLRRIVPAHPALRAEVVHAVRAEMAVTLADVVVRRTRLGVAGYPGYEAAREAAALMAHELGWNAAHIEAEVQALRKFYAPIDTA
jgi:glycerol-3-phosphate dehydrogenase